MTSVLTFRRRLDEQAQELLARHRNAQIDAEVSRRINRRTLKRKARVLFWTVLAGLLFAATAFADDGVSSPWTAVLLGVVLGLLLAGSILVIGNLILSDLTPKDEGKVLPPKGRW